LLSQVGIQYIESRQDAGNRKESHLDYGRLINTAFNLSWKNKSLWVFGFFAGYGANTDFNYSPSQDDSELEQFSQIFGDFDSFNFDPDQLMTLISAGIILLFVISILFFITHLIASPALVDSVNKITRGGKYIFSESFSVGIDFFWRFLGITVLGMITGLVTFLVLFAFGFAAFFVNIVLGFASLIILLPILLASIFGIYNIFAIGERALVVRNCSIGDALDEGYTLLKRNIGEILIFFLINIAFMMGLGILAAMIFMMVGIPIAIIGIASEASLYIWVMIGVFVGLPVSFVIGGWSATFFHSLYTVFYFELVESKPAAESPFPQH